MKTADGSIYKFAVQRIGDPDSWSGLLWPEFAEAELVKSTKPDPEKWEIVRVAIAEENGPLA